MAPALLDLAVRDWSPDASWVPGYWSPGTTWSPSATWVQASWVPNPTVTVAADAPPPGAFQTPPGQWLPGSEWVLASWYPGGVWSPSASWVPGYWSHPGSSTAPQTSAGNAPVQQSPQPTSFITVTTSSVIDPVSISSPVLPSYTSPTLPSYSSPTLPAGVTAYTSPTLAAGVSPTDATLPANTVEPKADPTTASGAATAPSSSTIPGEAPASQPYVTYIGNGAAFPPESAWVSDFDTMWTANLALINAVCYPYGTNSPAESAALKAAIQSSATGSKLDPRFILAVIMQESRGCVRVITTFSDHANPGVLQDHAGTANCNPGMPETPCPTAEITQMVEDGVFGATPPGTATGDGLLQTYAQAATFNPVTPASQYYIAARIYNSGSYVDGNLGCGAATHCYASDIANRITGWTGDGSPCSATVVSAGCPAS